VEKDAQQQWQERNPNTPWEQFKEAIRLGWERGRSRG